MCQPTNQSTNDNRRHVAPGGELRKNDGKAPAHHLTGRPDAKDQAAGEHVYDVVKVQMFMTYPPRGNSTAMELWRMLYPNGRSLEAFGSGEGGTHYRLCASTAHKFGSNEAAYRLTGFRMHTAPCVYAHLEPADEPAAQHQAGLRSRRGLNAEAWSLGMRKVLVLRTAFLNAPTLTATASLFPPMVTDLAAAVERMSSGRATLQIRYDPGCIYVVDYTLAQANDYNNNNLQFLASAKQKAEVHPIAACRIDSGEWATFKHYITALPPSNLPFAGSAAMPGNNLLLNGDQGLWVGTGTHELGHNMGLPHASRVDVVAQSDWYEYGNPYDTMGSAEGFPGLSGGLPGRDGMDSHQGLVPGRCLHNRRWAAHCGHLHAAAHPRGQRRQAKDRAHPHG